MEAMSIAAFFAAEILAMVLTWADPVLSETWERALCALAWPVVAVPMFFSGMALPTLCTLGAIVVGAAIVSTGGQPGVLFLDARAGGRDGRGRLWRRIAGYVGVILGCLGAGIWVVSSEGLW